MTSKDYEEVYEKLRRNGVATVENIVRWLKEAHVLEQADQTEQQAEAMFNDVIDKNKVDFEKFMQVLDDLSRQAELTGEELAQQLMTATAGLLEALAAAGTAFSSTLLSQLPDTSKKK